MADQLQILINTGFNVDTKALQSTLEQIQKNSKLSLNIDINNSNLSNLAAQIKQVNQEMNNATKNNRLTNQEKLNQLIERENQLKGELLIKQNQITSAQKLSNEEAEYNLKMFQQSMNIQADSLSRRYSYVSGAKDEIEKYRQLLQNITVENGKWYQSVRQADGSMKTQTVTAQQLRLQYRQMRNEIQGNIGIFDTLRQNMTKFGQYFFAGGFLVQGIRQIKEMFSYVNEMNSYLTNVRIITGSTAKEVSDLTQEYIDLGKALGATSTAVAQIAEDFYRQGKNAEETTKLIEATTMMAQLSGLGTSEASEYMTSIMNGFKINVSDMEDTVSKLVAVDNSGATRCNMKSIA